jgi:flavin-dependent dehydrogenase
MEKHDVVVVGAGPAGLSAAVKLAQNGTDVVLIEKDPIDLAKKAWVTFKGAVDAWDLKESVVAEIRGLNFNSRFGGGSAKASKKAGYTIDQSLFNKELLSKTELNVMDRVKVTSAERKDGKVRLRVGRETIESSIVIDATGSFAIIANMLGKRSRPKMGFTGYGAKLSADENLLPYFGLDEETVGFWGGSDRDLSTGLRGYMWDGALYPYREGSIDVCCGVTGPYPASVRKNALKNEYEYCRNRLSGKWTFLKDFYREGFSKGREAKRYWGFIKENLEPRPYDDNLLMVGDNTGRVSLVTGEGFLPAVVYGKMCADFATGMITEGKSDRGSLAQWGSLLEERELTGREWTKIVNLALRMGSDYAVALLISCLGRFAVKFDEDTLIALMSSSRFDEKEIIGFATEIMKHGVKLVLSKEYRKEFVSGEYVAKKYPDAKVWMDPKIKDLLGLGD